MADPANPIAEARTRYNITHWGEGYFDINERGHLVAGPGARAIDLCELATELEQAGLRTPVLVRFMDILRDRVERLCGAFSDAMSSHDYQGRYTAVYPIKVNQQRSVLEEIINQGGERVGLEAGSKPELMAVLALSGNAGGVVICNGYKDREYVRLALIGMQMGYRVYLVVEKLSELEIILRESRAMGVEPTLGVRVRLASLGTGKWQNTGGEKAKFGLSAAQVTEMMTRLEQAGMVSCLQLLHFHMGSQIANIRDMQRGFREAGRYYAELRRLGAPVRCVDVGGGLGIDYEGTHSRSDCSINYSIEEYARNVVHGLWRACSDADLSHPDIITESGRAMTAHHAVLVTNVVDIETAPGGDNPKPPADNAPEVVHELWSGLAGGTRSPVETYHDAAHWLAEARDLFNHGGLTLEQRAQAEQLFFATCQQVRPLLRASNRAHRELLDELNELLADKYFCNFSVFQSVPDVWAIQQVFPVVPLHRLDELPTRHAVLKDLTCDSDGRIDEYVEGAGVEPTVALHEFRPGEPYLLGVLLVGAYQEILGDIHNLFGDTNSVNVECDADGRRRLMEQRRGDTVADVLAYVHFSRDELLDAFRRQLAGCELPEAECKAHLRELEAGLSAGTYLQD